VNGTVSRNVLGDISASLNAAFQVNDSRSNLGLAPASLVLPAGNPFSPFASDVRLYRYLNPQDPLDRETDANAAHLGVAMSGALSKWIWSFTGNYDRATATTLTDIGADVPALQARLNAGDPAANPFADQSFSLREKDEAKSNNSSADAQLVLSGALFRMPAGEVSASVRGSAETRDFSSRSRRGGIEGSQDLSRDRGALQASLDIPIAKQGAGIGGIGRLSVNFNAEVEQLSDFGTLRTYGYGLVWSPVKALTVIASVTDEDGAPTVQQLGDPLLVTPNARLFDFVRGETVDALRITGGNPDLRADNRNVFKLGLSARPFEKKDLSFNVNYIRSRIDDEIAPFPPATAEIEAAFPERFTRSAEGRLLRVDSRPVNFARHDRQELRWGVNFSKPLGKAPPGTEFQIRFSPGGGPPPELPPGAVPMRVDINSPRGRQIEGMLSRMIFGFQHSWRLQDEILIRPGVPELDLLDGSALNSRGGQPRHELEFQAGAFQRGLGAHVTASWRSGTSVRGLPGAGSAGDLSFSDLATINLRIFADLGQRFGIQKYPWLRGTRLSLNVTNLLDSRQQVRDGAGRTPFSYQPAFLDPLGRSVNINLRKTFF
jgi:hypothetical protein